MNVLLAEDNPINQEIAIGLLETLNCTVTLAENGKEAVDAARDAAFDLVLMDCQMPVMDGFEATRIIRQSVPGEMPLPIVALTANDFDEAHAQCIAAGMDDVLGKPFSRQALLSLLQRFSPALAAPPASPAPAAPAEARVSSLDLSPIEALRMVDPTGERNLLGRAIEKFVDYSEDLVQHLAAAIDGQDVAEVSRAVHSLKSSSANLGATDLARQCAEIEKLTAGGSMPDDIGPRLSVLQATHRHAKEDLLALNET